MPINRPRAIWTAVKRAVQGRLVQSRRSTSATSSICRAFASSQTAALSPAPATPHPLSVSDPWDPVSEGSLRVRPDGHFTEHRVLKACGHRGLGCIPSSSGPSDAPCVDGHFASLSIQPRPLGRCRHGAVIPRARYLRAPGVCCWRSLPSRMLPPAGDDFRGAVQGEARPILCTLCFMQKYGISSLHS